MIYFVIVLYNKYLEDSYSLKSVISNFNRNEIIVIDNSDRERFLFWNKNNVKGNITYIQNKKNIGLSKSYNKVLKHIGKKALSGGNYICWLDDDTILDKYFFKELFLQTKNNYDIIVPEIVGQDGVIYSPNEKGFLKNKLVLNRNKKLNVGKFNAINSCLTVKTSIYNNYFYDERLFLDQVDQLFFDFIRINNPTFKILNVQVKQNFSQRGRICNNNYLARFAIRTRDIIQYGKISPCSSVFSACLKNILLGIHFSMKTYNVGYLKVSIESIVSIFKFKGASRK